MNPETLLEVIRQIVREEIVSALHDFADQYNAELEVLEARMEARIVAKLSK